MLFPFYVMDMYTWGQKQLDSFPAPVIYLYKLCYYQFVNYTKNYIGDDDNYNNYNVQTKVLLPRTQDSVTNLHCTVYTPH